MADVFVSYARKDKARVAPVVAALEEQGWSVWWDPAIDPGQEFDQLISGELARARAVLVVWTPASVESRWVRGEARDGADRGILVPVQFGPARLPIDFRAFHTTDLDDSGDLAGSVPFQDVVRALEALAGRPRRPTAAMNGQPSHVAGTQTSPQRITICVLPLANLSGDPAQEYFSDGITEDIITELSRWRLFSVRSRSASFRYRGVAVDMKHVARELDVRFIVEGSVRRMGARVRISAQLIDAETGSHIWAERFDRELEEMFTVQDEVVRTIVSTLVGRVQVSDVERARRKPPTSLEAYECVLKGNALPWDNPAAAAEATRLFQKAIEIDPGYGLAHALLSAMRSTEWQEDSGDSDAALQEAFALAKRAVELDENESTCFSMLGHVCLLQRSFDQALQYVRRAVELNPTNQWNAADLGSILIYVGQAEEALSWLRRAREIDPYFETPWYWRVTGQAYMILRRYDEALAMFGHLSSRTYRVAAFMAGCHARLGDFERARLHSAECLVMKPDFSIRQYVKKLPFKDPADAAALVETLALAGLPD